MRLPKARLTRRGRCRAFVAGTPPSQQNCNSQHLSYGFTLTTTLGCRSRGVDWIMIRILQDQENGHRNNCTSRFRVRDRRYRGQNLRMAPGRSIWPIHRSTFGPKWVTGLAEPAARLRTLRHSVCMFLGCLIPGSSLLDQRQIRAREPPPSRGGGG